MPADPVAAKAYRRPVPGKRYFTIEEANRALPYVARVVDDLTAGYGDIMELRDQLELAETVRQREAAEDRLEDAMDRLTALADELEQVGVILRHYETGLLDFPAIHDGREVFLCWRKGEAKIIAWHEIDEGFAGRQDVITLDHTTAAD